MPEIAWGGAIFVAPLGVLTSTLSECLFFFDFSISCLLSGLDK